MRASFKLFSGQCNRRHSHITPAEGRKVQLKNSKGLLGKGDIVSADCVGLAHQRQGLCMVEVDGQRLPTFVEGAVPGERITLQLTKVELPLSF
jgi:hypothetical protein